MATKTLTGLWAAALVLGLAVGCGGGGGGGGAATTGPTPSQQTSAQSANAAGQTVNQTAQIATNAVVESGAQGSTTAKTAVGNTATAVMTINYQASLTLTVDLDATDASGQDLYPNASGVFQVTANGTITGDSMNGEVQYDVTVVWQTNGVFTDPACNTQATILAGSQIHYALTIQWSKTDDLNWSIQATYDVNGSSSGTVTKDGHLWNFTGGVTLHASATFSRSSGNYSFTFSINGQKVITLDDGTESHVVTITMQALDYILIDVDGTTYGPFTLAQILWLFHFHCNG